MVNNSLTTLNTAITDYLAHERALGCNYRTEESVLNKLCRFVRHSRSHDLDASLFERWCVSQRRLSPNTRRRDQLLVRRFCLYRQRSQPACFVPDLLLFTRRQPAITPVLINPSQIARMLSAADDLSPTPNSRLRPAVLRLAVIILYTAGLRIGELARLQLRDVDERTGVLHIRESKFHRSRFTPLSIDARRELRQYLRLRLVKPYDVGPTAALLYHDKQSRTRCRGVYSVIGLQVAIRRLFNRAVVCDTEGRRPRVHDVRHSFAHQVLLRAYRSGADVQTLLPKLALYMGHVNIISTAYYLRFMPEVVALANRRFGESYSYLITTGDT